MPFTRADYEHAKALPTVVGPDEWVANDPNDGSIWAMHVSGRHFVRPTAWDLRNSHDTWLAETTASLLDDPWPASARALRDRGVVYAYASDTRYEGCRFGRTQLDADSRFEPVLVGETSTLYRVRW